MRMFGLRPTGSPPLVVVHVSLTIIEDVTFSTKKKKAGQLQLV